MAIHPYHPITPASKKRNLILLYVLSGFVLLAGIAFLIGSFFIRANLINAEGSSAAELDISEDYYFDMLYLLDAYAANEYDQDNMALYAAFFDDADTMHIVSFAPQKKEPLFSQVLEYLQSTDALLGDLCISAAVDIGKLSVQGDDLVQLYEEDVEYYADIFRSKGFRVECSDLHFDYLGADEAGYAEHRRSERLPMLIFGAIAFLVGLFLMLCAPRFMKKKWAAAEAQIPLPPMDPTDTDEATPSDETDA